jgi:hypothetical protein
LKKPMEELEAWKMAMSTTAPFMATTMLE